MNRVIPMLAALVALAASPSAHAQRFSDLSANATEVPRGIGELAAPLVTDCRAVPLKVMSHRLHKSQQWQRPRAIGTSPLCPACIRFQTAACLIR